MTWTDNSDDENGFAIERSSSPDSGFAEVVDSPAAESTTYFVDWGLSPSTTYFFRVRAFNAVGASAYSNVASATTSAPPVTAPAAPSSLLATTSSSSSIAVTWIDNSGNETAFELERSATSATAGFAAVPGSPLAAGTTGLTSTGLSASTTYWFRVRATNSAGASAYSNVASATTSAPPVTAPAAPSSLLATTSSSSSIALAWTDNSSNETAFELERSSTSASSGFAAVSASPLAAGTTSLTSTGLSASTTYWFRVRATNSAGASAYSNVASATTSAPPVTAPAAPSGLPATTASSSSIALAWTDNSSNETAFELERSSTSASSGFAAVSASPLAAGTTSLTSTGLSASTTYWFRVRATNSAGASAYSNVASATTSAPPVTIPAAPGGLTATATSSSSIALTWADNSSNETAFELERSASSATAGFVAVSASPLAAGTTSLTSTGLSSGTTYWFRVRATNSAGASAYSAVASATTSSGQVASVDAALAVLASHAVYFDHASVGSNVMKGVERLFTSASGAHPTRYSFQQTTVQASQVANGIWADHYFLADNGYPLQKMSEFETSDLGSSGLGVQAELAGRPGPHEALLRGLRLAGPHLGQRGGRRLHDLPGDHEPHRRRPTPASRSST